MEVRGDNRWHSRVERAAWMSVAVWIVGLPLAITIAALDGPSRVAFAALYAILAGCLAVVGAATLALPQRAPLGTVGAIASLAGVAGIAAAAVVQAVVGAGHPVWRVALVAVSLGGLLIVEHSRRELRRSRRGFALLVALAWACLAVGIAIPARALAPMALVLPMLTVWLLWLRRPPAPPGPRFARVRRIGWQPRRVFLAVLAVFTVFGLMLDVIGLIALLTGAPDTTAGDLVATLGLLMALGVVVGAAAAAVVMAVRRSPPDH